MEKKFHQEMYNKKEEAVAKNYSLFYWIRKYKKSSKKDLQTEASYGKLYTLLTNVRFLSDYEKEI